MLIWVRLKNRDSYTRTTSINTIIKYEVLAYLIILGTTIWYIFWVRSRMWWWYIYFWDVGVIFTNAYIIYTCIHNMNSNPRKPILSHHDFRKATSCELINLEKYNAGEFEVQSDILYPRRKGKLDLSSSCPVSTMTPDRSWQGWISSEPPQYPRKSNVDDNNLAPHEDLYFQPPENNGPTFIFSWREVKVQPS